MRCCWGIGVDGCGILPSFRLMEVLGLTTFHCWHLYGRLFVRCFCRVCVCVFHNCIVPLGLLPWEIWVAFPHGMPAATESCYPTYSTCLAFSVSIIHQTPTWTTGTLTCAQELAYAIAHEGCADTVRESALKVDSGRKIPCLTVTVYHSLVVAFTKGSRIHCNGYLFICCCLYQRK